jgi:tetratricopeptide (TPR) repeat protein
VPHALNCPSQWQSKGGSLSGELDAWCGVVRPVTLRAVFKKRDSTLDPARRRRLEEDLRTANVALRAASSFGDNGMSRLRRGEALANQGVALFRLGRLQEAADRCRDAYAVLSTADLSRLTTTCGQLAAALYGLSQFDEAVQLCERIQTQAPEHLFTQRFELSTVRLTHASALRALGRLDEAHAVVGELTSSARGTSTREPQMRNETGGPLPPDAIASFEKGLLPAWQELRRTFVRALLVEASIENLLGRADEAHSCLDEAIDYAQPYRSFPEFTSGLAEALYKKAGLIEEARDIRAAAEIYANVSSRFENSPDQQTKQWADKARLKHQALCK